MRTLAGYLPALVCGAMLLLVCIPMMRAMHKGHGKSDDTTDRQLIAELQEEVARLKAERALDNARDNVDG